MVARILAKSLPFVLLACSAAFAQTSTYSSSFSGDVQSRSFPGTAGNYVVRNADQSTTWFTYGGGFAGWVNFYEGSCEGQQYMSTNFTATTFDVICNDGVTKTEISGSYVKTPYCRYGICLYAVNGVSSITATPEELHSLGVPGY